MKVKVKCSICLTEHECNGRHRADSWRRLHIAGHSREFERYRRFMRLHLDYHRQATQFLRSVISYQ
jgi:hypothetical protein